MELPREKIAAVLRRVADGAYPEEDLLARIIWPIKGNGGIYVHVDTGRAITELHDILLEFVDASCDDDHDWVQRQVLETAHSVAAAAIEEREYQAIIDSFISEVEGWISEWTVAVPILGISLFHRTLQLSGFSLQIVGERKLLSSKANETGIEQFERQYRKRYYDDECWLTTEHKSLKDLVEHAGVVHFLIKVHGTPSRAKSIGLEAAQHFIDIIRFCSEEMFAINVTVKVGLMGEVNLPPRQTLILDRQLALVESDRLSPPAVFNLDVGMFKFKKRKIDELLKVLGKKDRSKLEEDILLSIRSYSLGYRHKQYGISFINIITALECFVEKSSNSSSVVIKIVSMLICHDREDRKDIRKEMVRLYKLRNDIVHDGFESTPDEDLKLLESYYARFVVAIVEKLPQWTCRQEILEFVNTPND